MQPPVARPKKFARRYPWRDWFSLETFRLRRGIHYDCRTDSMAQAVRFAARDMRLLADVAIADDSASLTVRVVGHGRRRRGRPKGGNDAA